MISKMVLDRQRACNAVLSALRNAGPTAATNIQELLAPRLLPEESAPDFALFLDLLARHLEGLMQELLETDQAYQNELSDDPVARDQRDTAFFELSEKVGRYRGYVRQLHGLAGERRILGVEGETARSPNPLLQQAQAMVARLRDPELELPEADPDFPTATIDPEVWSSVLDRLSQALQRTLQDVEDETRETQASWERRLKAMEAFDAAYVQVVTLGESSLFLGGLPEQARRMRFQAPDRGSSTGGPESGALRPEAPSEGA